VKRTGPLRERLAVFAMRSVGLSALRLAERVGVNTGSTEGPPIATDPAARPVFDELVAAALAGDGTIAVGSCPYPLHELLTYLVSERNYLLHGSNDPGIEMLEPRPARDLGTELHAVVACDDGIWPLFYAVVTRERIEAMFTNCMHVGRPPRVRRLYMFAIVADPAADETWTPGVVYALPRDGFRREWGNEWVSAQRVQPVLRVPATPDDFPLRESVVGLSDMRELRRVFRHLRASTRARSSARAPSR
jgi:hypothetical protein